MTPRFLFITFLIRLILKNRNLKGDNSDLYDNLALFKDFSKKIWPFTIIIVDFPEQKSEIHYI